MLRYTLTSHLFYTSYFPPLYTLQVIDLLVRYLKLDVSSSSSNARLAERIVLEAYDVIEAYLLGDSRKNELYFAKYIDYFNTQFNAKVSE